MPGGKNGLLVIGILSTVVALAFLANAVHGATPTTSTTSSTPDPDVGLACTGTGDNQQGDCNTQVGDQTGVDIPGAEAPGLED